MNSKPSTPKEFRLWENPDNWIDLKEAKRFIDSRFLKGLMPDTRICIIPGGEIADGFLITDTDVGYRILINGKWKSFQDPDIAYQTFLKQDHWAS